MWVRSLLVFFLCLPVYATPVQEAAALEAAIDNGELLQKTEKALNALFITAGGILRKKGYPNEAYDLEAEWFDRHQYDLRVYASSRGLGDWQPISTWLKEKTDMLTFILGVDLMKKTHLIDLVVFNHAIPVVFKPCNQPWSNADEYRKHFSRDQDYQGNGHEVCALMPVVSYWGSYAGCMVGTIGTGFGIVCGIGAEVVERLVCKFVSDGLSDRVFNKACGGDKWDR